MAISYRSFSIPVFLSLSSELCPSVLSVSCTPYLMVYLCVCVCVSSTFAVKSHFTHGIVVSDLADKMSLLKDDVDEAETKYLSAVDLLAMLLDGLDSMPKGEIMVQTSCPDHSDRT